MDKTISLEEARMKLARIWFIGSGVPFFLMILQTLLGKYEPKTQEAWAWFIPLVFPTLTLMVSVMGSESLKNKNDNQVRKSFVMLVVWLSTAYILALSMVIFIEPLSTQDASKLFSNSNFFLGPLQAVVVGGMGYLFTRETKVVRQAASGVRSKGQA